MKILVVYYSLEGNTDYIAQMIARKCGAVLERLRPENEPPKNALRYIIGGREAKTPVEGEGFAELSEAAELTRLEAETVGRDVLLTGYVKKEDMPLWLKLDAEES